MKRALIWGLGCLTLIQFLPALVAGVVQPLTSVPDCVTPPAGLVGWWPGNGNADDVAGGNAGALVAGATFANGKVSQGFRFDGTNSYVQIPDSAALKPANITVEAWVWLDPNLTNHNGGEQIVFKKNTWSAWFEGYSLLKYSVDNGDGTYTDRFQFCVSRSGNQVPINSQTIVQRGVWYHVAATYDGNQSILYVNGVAEASATPGFALDYDSTPVYLGTSGTWAPYLSMFGGVIDEVSIYSRALSANEIAAIYNASSAGKCGQNCVAPAAGLVAWWPAEGNATDAVGTNNGVTLGGVSYAAGEVGQAFNFEQADSAVMVPASASLNVGSGSGFTLEAWINPTDVTQAHPLFEWNDSNWWGVHFHIAPGQPSSGTPGPGQLYANVVDSFGGWHQLGSAGGVVASNVFQHVALTYDKSSGVATIYCNGEIVSQQNLGSFTPLTSYALYLGRRPAPSGEEGSYAGLLDEPAVYNRALSPTDIRAIYQAGSAGKCDSAVITQSPESQTTVAGSDLNLTVGLGGVGPFTYQWRFNGTNISGATNATLSLNNLHAYQAGTYSVVVTTPTGVLTSSGAVVTVTAQDLLIYNYVGSEKYTTLGQELNYKYSGQLFLTPANTNGAFIGWTTLNGKKQYWVGPFSDFLWVTIPGSLNHTYTVLGRAGDGIDDSGFPHLWAYLHRGLNTPLVIANKRKFSFPTTFTGSDTHVYPDSQTGNLILREATSTHTFAIPNTQTANDSGQTVTDVLNAQIKVLVKQGYQKQ